MTQPHNVAPQQPPEPLCFRHPGRVSYIRCQRCGRPICPECMIQAAVGYQCPECVDEGIRTTRQNQGPYGGTRSKNPSLTSIALIAINAAVWLGVTLNGGYTSWLTWWLSLRPLGSCVVASDPSRYLPGSSAAACEAATGMAWAPGVADGAWWQLITSAFLHIDFPHVGFNMLALWFLGPQLERVVGRARFLALYLLSGLAGSAAVMWLSAADTMTLGASGAVFGLMGALLVLVRKVGGNLQPVLIWLGINVAYTFVGSGISWQGHLGGLIGGAAIALILAYAPRERRAQLQALGLAGFGLLLVALILARSFSLA